MGMLGEVISGAAHSFGRGLDASYGQSAMRYGIITPGTIDTPNIYDLTPVWTLQQYKANLEEGQAAGDGTEAALEDLEKSIVANLADDVIVGVKRDRIELVITMSLGH
jgi:hypothetical protein